MILYTQTEFDSAKSRQQLPLQCDICSNKFYSSKHAIYSNIRLTGFPRRTCSKSCTNKLNSLKEIKCKQCNIVFKPNQATIQFCSKSCATSFNNQHKTYGTRRSKAEIYIATKLIDAGITCILNGKLDNFELDIFIPNNSIAIEVNGPTHYKPIYGEAKFKRIQERDKLKADACLKHDIKLICLDVSQDDYHKSLDKYDNFVKEILSILE